MIVLDTHVLLWQSFADRQLGSEAIRLIANDNDRCVSAMLSWELAMQLDKGRIILEQPLERWLMQTFRYLAIEEVAVNGVIARDAGGLPGDVHGDPCDRIMIATARVLDCPLLTADRKILAYAAAGYLKAVDARA